MENDGQRRRPKNKVQSNVCVAAQNTLMLYFFVWEQPVYIGRNDIEFGSV